MNAIDKMIGYFSPERAYRRAQYRAAAEAFAYDGAKSGRRTDGWYAAGGDANTEVGAGLVQLRNRSRDLLRNNPYATKAIAELVGNTVGLVDRADDRDRFPNDAWITAYSETALWAGLPSE
jgi:capsid protein